MFEPRVYQTVAQDNVREVMRQGKKRVILHSPTGSGKTEMGFDFVRSAAIKHRKVIFLASRITLVDQTSRRLTEAGIDHGVIQGSNTHSPWMSVLVGSIQTIARRGMPEDIELIIIDEAHASAGTKAYREVMQGRACIGLTATPYSKGLGKHYVELGGALWEEVVTAAEVQELIDLGFLVTADVWAPSEPDLSKVRVVAGDYNEADLHDAMDKGKLVGDIITHWLKLANGKSTVVFATSRAHGAHICTDFVKSGVKAEYIDCFTKDEDRRLILDRVKSGETTIIVNVAVLAEGWDCPSVECLILARPTKSLIRYLQMAGRVLRPAPGKERAIILDHSGTIRRLGFPWDDHHSPLDDGKPKTGGAKKQKVDEEPLPKVCGQCSYLKPPKTPVCPQCGFTSVPPRTAENLPGELVKLTSFKKMQISAAHDVSSIPPSTLLAELLWIAKDKGYKQGWAAANYREIHGAWPRESQVPPLPPSPTVLNWIRLKNKAFFLRNKWNRAGWQRP